MYKIVFLSDFHIKNDKDFTQGIQTLTHALQQNPDHLILGGDLTDLPDPCRLRQLADFFTRQGVFHENTLTVVPGNHDVFPISKRPPWIKFGVPALYRRAFQRLFEPVLHNQEKRLTPRIALVALDSTSKNTHPTRWASGELSSAQLDKTAKFLLAQKGSVHRIIVLHHRPWRVLQRAENSRFPMGMSTPSAEDTMNQLQRGRPTLILAGHYHTFEDQEIGRAHV